MTDSQKQGELVYAGFWIRLWASAIDSVLAMMIILPFFSWFYGSSYWRDLARLFQALMQAFRGEATASTLEFLQSYSQGGGALDVFVSYVAPAVAVILFWIYRSATPGKMAVGARIVDAESGRQPTSLQLIARYFGYFVSLFPLGLGFLWVALDDRKQGWHDKISGTVVVRRKRMP